MKPFYLNFGVTIKGVTYRLALLNRAYKSIENTLVWNRGWKKWKGRFYTNRIII